MSDDPLVSIIVPVRNRANVLPRCIHSALAQTHANHEILIVDDGSEDDTPVIAKALATRFAQISFVGERQNRGAAFARNLGAEHAAGEFLAFLDSDDEWMPEKLAAQIAFLRENPTAVAASCRTLFRYGWPFDRVGGPRPGMFTAAEVFAENKGGCSSMLVRKKAFDAIGGFNPDLPSCQDWDLWARLAQVGKIGAVAPAFVIYHFDGGARISSRVDRVIVGHRHMFAMLQPLIAQLPERPYIQMCHDMAIARIQATQEFNLLRALRSGMKAFMRHKSRESLKLLLKIPLSYMRQLITRLHVGAF